MRGLRRTLLARAVMAPDLRRLLAVFNVAVRGVAIQPCGAAMSALPRARHGRPRGFSKWRPQADTARLVEAVVGVLDEYAEYLPLTIRQIFYRLVVTINYEKSEKGYARLQEALNRARRARLIPFDSIRDDGFHHTGFIGWDSVEHAQRSLERTALNYRIDRQRNQDTRLVVWCEAQGMVPQLERVAGSYSVPVYSSGGFDSVTVKHSIAQEFAEFNSVCVLHLGDHDPSGVHVFGSLDEDINAFLGATEGCAEFIRLAVTPEQVDAYDLPTAIPKRTDRQAFDGLTTQCEALPPDLLAEILEAAIRERLDLDVYHEALREEVTERTELVTWLGGAA